MSFDLLGLSAPILKALKDQGYENPTPIQEKAIPPILEGRDIMAAAQTGTGKTAGFTLPMLEKLSKGRKVSPNHIRALVLTPTRELAHQVSDSIASYSKHLDISSTVVYGGVKINPQMMKLRRGIDILVATPGRLLDLHNQNAVKFNQVEMFVLDEADRMLDMGFIHDIKKLIAKLPRKRQNLMFSATFSSDIRGLAKKLINDPVEVSVSVANSTTKLVEQLVHPVDKSKKTALLAHLIVEKDWQQVLVFMRTKHSANRLVKNLLSKNIEAVAIHGNKSQNARMKALSGFKDGEFRVLVATDIVARGLDIEELPQVVNYDLPKVSEDYVHRIGRTGRAGKTGEAVSFVTVEDAKELKGIERLIKKVIEREVVKGFEPTTGIKVSVLDTRPLRPKKPKKAKSEIQKTFKSDTKTSEVKTSRVSRPKNDYVQKGKIKNTKSDEKLDNTKRSYRKKK